MINVIKECIQQLKACNIKSDFIVTSDKGIIQYFKNKALIKRLKAVLHPN